MKISFSTLGCPEWALAQIVDTAVAARCDGLELRFVEGEASLWKLAAFQGTGLRDTRKRITEAGLEVSCVDTSCRFDSPEKLERERQIEEGARMAELAAELRAPGIRVFGDRIQPGAGRDATRDWIREGLSRLVDRTAECGVEVWLETHGDFSCANDVLATLPQRSGVGLVWDAASAFVECGERPIQHGTALQSAIRHVHIKDLRNEDGKWIPVLTGEGQFPLPEIWTVLKTIKYDRFLSFEWEKKWHPEIEEPQIAISHFARWFRERWQALCVGEDGLASGAHD